MRGAKIIILGILSFTLLTGWTAVSKKLHLPANYKIKNIHHGIAKEYDTELVKSVCSNFTLTEAEIRAYFKKTDVISAHVREKGFDWLPCYVQGELVMDGKNIPFEIEASATGWIKYSDKNTVWLGCKEACSDMFNHK